MLLWIAIVAGVAMVLLGLLIVGVRRVTCERNEQRAALSDIERIIDASSKKEGGPPA